MLATVADVRLQLRAYAEDMARWLLPAQNELDAYNASHQGSETDIAGLQTIWQDGQIQSYLQVAQNSLETDLNIHYDSQSVGCSWSDDTFDMTEDPYDFYASQYSSFGFLVLRRRPVQSVERVRLMYSAQNHIITYPASWIRVDRKMGRLSIVPTPGTGLEGLVMINGSYWLPTMAGLWLKDMMPQLIAVDYTVGLSDSEIAGAHYKEHAHHITRLALRECLVELSDVYKAGMASESVSEDGLSETTQWTRSGGRLKYGDKIAQVDTDYQRFVKEHQHYDSPFLFTVV